MIRIWGCDIHFQLAALTCLTCLNLGYRDHRRPDDAVIEQISLLEDLYHGVGLGICLDRRNRLMAMRIEFLARGINFGHPKLGEYRVQLLQRELDAAFEVINGYVAVGERCLEAVLDG